MEAINKSAHASSSAKQSLLKRVKSSGVRKGKIYKSPVCTNGSERGLLILTETLANNGYCTVLKSIFGSRLTQWKPLFYILYFRTERKWGHCKILSIENVFSNFIKWYLSSTFWLPSYRFINSLLLIHFNFPQCCLSFFFLRPDEIDQMTEVLSGESVRGIFEGFLKRHSLGNCISIKFGENPGNALNMVAESKTVANIWMRGLRKLILNKGIFNFRFNFLHNNLNNN